MTILYHQDKRGTVRQWECWVEGDEVVTEYGEVGGLLQESRKIATPKNEGKANETTGEEQAEIEAKALIKKKLDLKYSPTMAKAKAETRIRPMLAHGWEKHKHKIEYPASVQPKLDGVRCLAYWEDDSIVLLSRSGKEYHIPHIAEEVASFLPKQVILDGEIYVHGIPFQSFMSLVKRNQPESIKLEYRVYDVISRKQPDMPWNRRLKGLTHIFNKHTEGKVKPVKTMQVYGPEEVMSAQAMFIHMGYEGAIVRGHDEAYRAGYRSAQLLKVKTFDDDEFPIVDYKEGVGKMAGAIVWVCETPEGDTFSVIPMGTMEQRRFWYENAEDYIGELLTVKYFGKSENNIPRFPIGKEIR